MPHEVNEQARVLIVDDEPQVACALGDVLEDRYRVLIETSPERALATLQADKAIAAVVSDQRMPGMTGDQLFRHAQSLSNATRILITAYADIGAVIDAVNQGNIFAYVTKPWQSEDITLTVKRAVEHCELNRKILHARALLHQLMESSVDAISIKNRDHQYLKLNGYEARILGAQDAADVEGRTAADFLPRQRLESLMRDEHELFSTGAALRDRVESVAGGDGRQRWYSSNLAPIRDVRGDVVGLVRITRDISESKRLDEMKDQFIATVRHELRTPLTAIHAALGLLRGGALSQNAGQAARLVEIGHENCARLLALVGDLLDTVNLEKGEMLYDLAALEVADLAAAAVAASREQAERKGVELRIGAEPPPLRVRADRGRLLQALAKLIANAVEATPAGGEIRVEARELRGGAVRISVRDQGPGVSAELAPRLFNRFSQGDSSNAREKGGVGLGLFIARSLVEAQGGAVGFTNNVDRGAEFFVELPIWREPPAAQRAAALQ
jgi:two-component system cell cycle sensor histidine kinase PleC